MRPGGHSRPHTAAEPTGNGTYGWCRSPYALAPGTLRKDDGQPFQVFSPFHRTYIRRYVPESSDVPLEHLHEPWKDPAGRPAGYPGPIVDHAAERKEALDRYSAISGG